MVYLMETVYLRMSCDFGDACVVRVCGATVRALHAHTRTLVAMAVAEGDAPPAAAPPPAWEPLKAEGNALFKVRRVG